MYFPFSLHLYSMGVLVVIYFSLIQRRHFFTMQINLFYGLLFVNMVLLLLDFGTLIFEGNTSLPLQTYLLFMNSMYYFMIPFASMMWLLYVHYLIHLDVERTKWLMRILASVPIGTFTLIFINLFTPIVFDITSLNTYTREWGYWIIYGMTYVIVLYSFGYAMKYRKSIRHEDLTYLSLFIVPPMVAGVLAGVFYMKGIIWPSMTISMLFLFIGIQGRIMNTDYLTRVANRQELDNYLNQMMHHLPFNRKVGGFMIDMDDFKVINDEHGHTVGDTALKKAAELIRHGVRRGDFIARYGGDEFVVICMIYQESELHDIMQRIQHRLHEMNTNAGYPFQLSFSYGLGIFSPETDGDLHHFLKRIDDDLYNSKRDRSEVKLTID